MLAQRSGPNGKAPRREADWFLAASCTFSFCSTLKNVSDGYTHCLQYLQPEKEKAPPDSLFLMASLFLACLYLTLSSCSSEIVRTLYLMFLL